MTTAQTKKAASAVPETFALIAVTLALIAATALGAPPVRQAMADDGEDAEPTSAELAAKVSYYGSYEGSDTVTGWKEGLDGAVASAREKVDAAAAKANGRPDVDWARFRAEMAAVNEDISHAWSLSSAKKAQASADKLDVLADNMIEERDAQIEAERIAAEEEAARIAAEEAAAYASYYGGGSYSGGGYHPTGGLTPQSGVNYYGDQRETYYSSNVLYHKDTASWNVDSEGFYRTDDGYYVVAANNGQYSYGDTYEGSKGTCIVLDSGCAYGTTDYYVAW